MIRPLFLALSLISFVAAQSNNTALDIEAIEAHFKNAGLVPDLLANFTPSAAMSVSFPGVGVIQPGQALSRDRESIGSHFFKFFPRTKCSCSGGTNI